ncbi:MAG: zinc-dependent metalloprotease family protein [Candidatus Thermoplasmatota archaeon]|nr:zinc-dependent metalloprotease family protein [Candidatus Thermoplasmatota archaeon]
MSVGIKTIVAPLMALLVALAGCNGLPNLNNPQGVGANYESYLTGGGVLVLELDHSPGKAPPERVKDAMRQEMSRITQKTVEIQTAADLPSRSADHTWSVDELTTLAEQHQDQQDRQGVVVMHALFVDGRIQNERIAGLAFLADTYAFALGTMEQNTCADSAVVCASGKPRYSNALRAVAIHEAGHLFGLVDITLPMVQPHEDQDHEGHSDNPDSVMWWEVEVGTRLSNLITGGDDIPWQFDQNDIRDARAIQQG